MFFSKKKGFSLIELLIAFGIIVVLAGAIIFAISPGERMAKARDDRRENDVQTIYGAIEQYIFQNKGVLPPCFDDKEAGEIFDAYECEPYLSPDYVLQLPRDPFEEDVIKTGYLFKKNSSGDVGTYAYYAESGERIFAGNWPEYCLDFDGVDDYVEISHTQILSDEVFGTNNIFTLSAWAHPEDWISYSTIINKATGGSWSNTTNGLWSYSSGFRCVMGSNVGGNPAGSYIGVVHKPALDTWHHIACVGDGTDLIMYIDGSEVGRTAISNLTYERSSNESPLVFGRRSAGTNESFPGLIDNICVYTNALSESEVKSLYNGRNITDGLVGHWTMNEGEGDTVYDLSGNENYGTITGGATWSTNCE